jgi:hypothetical protein
MHGVARSGMVLSEAPDAEAIAMKWQMVGLPANPFDLLEQNKCEEKGCSSLVWILVEPPLTIHC